MHIVIIFYEGNECVNRKLCDELKLSPSGVRTRFDKRRAGESIRPREDAPKQIDRCLCAAAKGVFFKKAEMHCKGGLFDKFTV